MAKKTKSVSFTNATIDLEDRTIIEVRRDETTESSLDALLTEWDGVPGISLTIRLDEQCTIG